MYQAQFRELILVLATTTQEGLIILHFTDGEIEAQRGNVNFSGSHS